MSKNNELKQIYHIRSPKNTINPHKGATSQDNINITNDLKEQIKKKIADIERNLPDNVFTADTQYNFKRVNKTYKDYL